MSLMKISYFALYLDHMVDWGLSVTRITIAKSPQQITKEAFLKGYGVLEYVGFSWFLVLKHSSVLLHGFPILE